jgi:hypothetical protein
VVRRGWSGGRGQAGATDEAPEAEPGQRHDDGEIIMQAHGALDGPIITAPASIQVITPFNVPPEAAG